MNILISISCLLSLSVSLFFLFRFKKQIKYQKNENDTLKGIIIKIANEVAVFERDRITESLHHDVGMIVAIAKLNLDKVSRNLEDKLLCKKLLNESMVLLSDCCQAIRDIGIETPSELIRFGYENGVAELCRLINISGEIRTSITLSEKEIRLPPLYELYLYCITKELIANIIKHSNATELKIEIQSTSHGVKTALIHNGLGVTSEEIKQFANSTRGLGLKSIEKRIGDIDGTIDYFSDGISEPQIVINVPVYE